MTMINTTDDFIRLLQENEEFLAAARRVIYTQDLVELPARFTEYTLKTDGRLQSIESDVSTLKEDVSTLKEDVSILKEDVGTLKEDVGTLKEDMDTVKDDVGTLQGYNLERKMHSRLRQRIGRALGLQKARALWTARIGAQATGRAEIFENLTDTAVDNGVITDSEAGRLLDTDMIMTGTRIPGGELVHIAVEASSGIRTLDVNRARESASILQRLYGTEAIDRKSVV